MIPKKDVPHCVLVCQWHVAFRCGVESNGMVYCGVMKRVVEWCDVVWCGVVRCRAAWRSGASLSVCHRKRQRETAK